MMCKSNNGQKDLLCELNSVDSNIALHSVVERKHSNLYVLLFVVSAKGWILVGQLDFKEIYKWFNELKMLSKEDLMCEAGHWVNTTE